MEREIGFALRSQQICKIVSWMFCSPAEVGEPPQTVEFNMKEIITQRDVFVHQNWPVKRLKQLRCKRKTKNHGA